MEVDFYSVVSMPQMKCILIWSKSIFYKVIYFADFVNKMRLEFPQNYPPKINLLSFVIHNFQKMAKI